MSVDFSSALSNLILTSERLILRPPREGDALPMAALANDRRVAEGTLNMPFPYDAHDAEVFIEVAREARMKNAFLANAVERKGDGVFIGVIGLAFQLEYNRAELGYWLGVPFWNQGYTTEAARILLDFAFRELRLNRVYAAHYGDNPASGRVMQKLGMAYEGTLRQHLIRLGRPRDSVCYGILRDEWLAKRRD